MKRNEKGQVLVLVALAIFVLLGFAALGIDVGYMYSVRHELQRCADSGALAGASAFRETGLNSDDSAARDLATVRATDFATRDLVVKSRLMTVPGDIVVVSFPQESTKMRVQVDVKRTVPLFFARVLGWSNKEIPATATAEAFGVCKKVRCVVPWGIPVPWPEGVPFNWTGPPSSADCDRIAPSYTGWDANRHEMIGTPTVRDQYLCQGSLQELKIGTPGSTTNPGNFLALNLRPLLGPEGCPSYRGDPSGNNGADFYYWLIEHSCECDLKPGTDPIEIQSEPGEMVKRTITAVAPSLGPNYYRDSYYPDGSPYLKSAWEHDSSVPESLMNSDPGGYWGTSAKTLGGAPSTDNSGRIVRIPVFDPTISYTGRSDMTPLAYVGFWIQDIKYTPGSSPGGPDLGSVFGRFISVEGEGTYEEECGSTVLNIRLVK